MNQQQPLHPYQPKKRKTPTAILLEDIVWILFVLAIAGTMVALMLGVLPPPG